MSVTKAECASCEFARQSERQTHLMECRRRAPRVFLSRGNKLEAEAFSVFPPVSPTDWCGDYKVSTQKFDEAVREQRKPAEPPKVMIGTDPGGVPE